MTMRPGMVALGLLALLAAPARAHVVLDQAEAPADAYVRLAFRVGHGCDGRATTALRLTVPPELGSARPMPHPGWTLSLSGPPAEHAGHDEGHRGASLPAGIAWTGGRLDGALYDEFVLMVRTPATPGATLLFPVVQECEGGVTARWMEEPAAPGSHAGHPAPALRLLPR